MGAFDDFIKKSNPTGGSGSFNEYAKSNLGADISGYDTAYEEDRKRREKETKLRPKVQSYAEGFYKLSDGSSRKSILEGLKRRGEAGDELAAARFNAIVGDQRINQAAPQDAGLRLNPLEKVVQFGAEAGKALVGAPTYFAKSAIINPAREITAQLNGNEAALQAQERRSNVDLGLGAEGTDLAGGFRKLGGKTAELVTLPLGGRSLITAARAGGAKAVGKEAAKTGAAAGVGSAGYTISEDREAGIGDVAKSGLIGAGVGIGGSAVISGVGAGFRALRQVKGPTTKPLSTQASGQIPADYQELVDSSIQAASAEKNKYKRNTLQKFYQGAKETLNVTTEFRKIDNLKADRAKVNVGKLPRGESLEAAYDNFINATIRADQLIDNIPMSTGDRVSDVLQRHASDIEEFNVYRNAIADKYARSKKVTFQKNLTNEQLDEIIKGYEARFPEARKDVTTLNEAVNTARKVSREAGGITEDLDIRLGDSKDYTPVAAAASKDVPQVKIGGRSATTGKQKFVKEATGPADVPLDTTFEPIINYIRGAYKNAAQAKVSQLILDAHKSGLIKGSKLLSEPAAKSSKKELRDYAKTVTVAATKLQKQFKMTQKEARVLESEINKFNKEALEVRLKEGGQTMPKIAPAGFGGKVPTSKAGAPTGEPITGTRPDFLKESYEDPKKFVDDYANMLRSQESSARGGIKVPDGEGGYKRTSEHSKFYRDYFAANKRAPSKAAYKEQALKELNSGRAAFGASDEYKQLVKDVGQRKSYGRLYDAKDKMARDVLPSKLGPRDTKRFFRELIEADPAVIDRLKQKIALREPRLAAKLDQVQTAKDEVFALRSEAKGARQATFEIVDDPATNKSAIRGMDENGSPYTLELPPEMTKLLRGTDAAASNPIINMLLNVQRGFQTFWTGFANPVFNFVTAPLYDVAANVNALVDNPSAFLRSFTPDSFGNAIKGLRDSDQFRQNLIGAGAAPQGGSLMPSNISKSVESIISRRNLASRTGYLAKNPKEFVQVLDNFSGKLGNATRTRIATGYYKDALKRKLPKEDALKEAAFAYNNIAPNFNRVSDLARNANAFIPYFTAGLAGNRSMWQPILANPARAAAVYGGVASTFIGATAYNLSNDAGEKFYEEMLNSDNRYVLDNNYIIVLPTASKNEATGQWTGIIKIPVAPEYRNMNKLARESTQQLATGDSKLSPKLVAGAVLNTMTGGTPDSLLQGPAGVRTLQVLAGAKPTGSMFTPEPLITGQMANLSKEEQEYPWTSSPAKLFSKITGSKVSPIQADAIIGQLGIVGRGVQGQGITEQVTGKFTGARTQSLPSKAYEQTAPDFQALTSKMKKEGGGINNARRVAEQHNAKVDRVIDMIRNSTLSQQTKDEEIEKLNSRKASLKDYALRKRLE